MKLDTWMTDNWTTLKNMKFTDLVLPCTHNSAAYQIYYDTNSNIYTNLPYPYNVLSYFSTIVNQYTINQKYDITEQLMCGVRMFSIKVAMYNDIYYCTHTYICGLLFDGPNSFIKQIMDFIIKYPNEKLILRIIEDDIHAGTISYNSLQTKVQSYLQSSVSMFQGTNGTVESVFKTSVLLIFPNNNITYNWYNTSTFVEFKNAFKNSVCNSGILELDVVLTPTDNSIFNDVKVGIAIAIQIQLLIILIYIIIVVKYDFKKAYVVLCSFALVALSIPITYSGISIGTSINSISANSVILNNYLITDILPKNRYSIYSIDYADEFVTEKIIEKNFETNKICN